MTCSKRRIMALAARGRVAGLSAIACLILAWSAAAEVTLRAPLDGSLVVPSDEGSVRVEWSGEGPYYDVWAGGSPDVAALEYIDCTEETSFELNRFWDRTYWGITEAMEPGDVGTPSRPDSVWWFRVVPSPRATRIIAHPNPFDRSVTFWAASEDDTPIESIDVMIYDAGGSLVYSDGAQCQGSYASLRWFGCPGNDGGSLSSGEEDKVPFGLYFCHVRVKTSAGVEERMVKLLRCFEGWGHGS